MAATTSQILCQGQHLRYNESVCSSLVFKVASKEKPTDLGLFPSLRPRPSSAAGDLRVSGRAGASELGLLGPSPSKMDLSRFSFSAKEQDPITAHGELPRKP